MTRLQLNHLYLGLGLLEIEEVISDEKLEQLNSDLSLYGIEIVENSKSQLVQKIKEIIIDMVYKEEKLPVSKISAYLADKLNHSYGYISNLFSELTFTSIENFIILQKIERAKQLITTNEFNFTEISFKLNYSSVAHFSTQFKNATGLTPSAFQRIIKKRQDNLLG